MLDRIRREFSRSGVPPSDRLSFSTPGYGHCILWRHRNPRPKRSTFFFPPTPIAYLQGRIKWYGPVRVQSCSVSEGGSRAARQSVQTTFPMTSVMSSNCGSNPTNSSISFITRPCRSFGDFSLCADTTCMSLSRP